MANTDKAHDSILYEKLNKLLLEYAETQDINIISVVLQIIGDSPIDPTKEPWKRFLESNKLIATFAGHFAKRISALGDEELRELVSEAVEYITPPRYIDFLKLLQDVTLDVRRQGLPDAKENLRQKLEELKTDYINAQPINGQLSIFGDNDIIDASTDNEYFSLHSTSLTNLVKQYLNNPTRLESPKKGRITVEEHYLTKDTIITYKGTDAQYTLSVERVKELFAKRVQNGAKIFNFLLQKLNEQNLAENTEFLLNELVDVGIYANPDSAYRGLKNVTDKLMRIHIEGTVTVYEGKKRKEKSNVKAALIAQRKVTYNQCTVVLPPILRNSAPYITVLPLWGYTLPSENAYMLLDYIYYMARQRTENIKERGYFTIGLDTVRQHLGLLSPEEVKEEYKGNYNTLIVKPIEEAITAIEDGQQGNDLAITPVYDHNYKSIHEYLDGYLEIRLSGNSLEYMKERATMQEKRQTTARRLDEKKKAALPAKKEDAAESN